MDIIKGAFIAICLSSLLPSWAGDKVGGGGDETESRVNDIREDLLKWIKNGGAKGLKLPQDVSLNQYTKKMTDILKPKKVTVIFVESDHARNDELMVQVGGFPKTCRGFISKKKFQSTILCNIARFTGTSPDGQYRLIHHEYAGLAGIEKNEGASSEYSISNQISGYLATSTVLRLAVVPINPRPMVVGVRGVWDLSYDGGLFCYPESEENPGYKRNSSQPIDRRWCDEMPGNAPGGDLKGVWDLSYHGELFCYPESAKNPGYKRISSQAIDRSWCDKRPGSAPGGDLRGVWDLSYHGVLLCYPQDHLRPRYKRPSSQAIDRSWCDKRPGTI